MNTLSKKIIELLNCENKAFKGGGLFVLILLLHIPLCKIWTLIYTLKQYCNLL
jgi:hypothetical protein